MKVHGPKPFAHELVWHRFWNCDNWTFLELWLQKSYTFSQSISFVKPELEQFSQQAARWRGRGNLTLPISRLRRAQRSGPQSSLGSQSFAAYIVMVTAFCLQQISSYINPSLPCPQFHEGCLQNSDPVCCWCPFSVCRVWSNHEIWPRSSCWVG